MIFFRRRRDLYYELVVKQLSFQETLETLEHRWEKYIKPMLEDAGGAFILVGNFRENGISSYKKKTPCTWSRDVQCQEAVRNSPTKKRDYFRRGPMLLICPHGSFTSPKDKEALDVPFVLRTPPFQVQGQGWRSSTPIGYK